MAWRYQPVIVFSKVGSIVDEEYCVCEVYFDEAGKLKNWTQSHKMSPSGNTINELQSDLVQMLTDASCWVPVKYEDLRVGMEFERAVTKEQREKIARMIDSFVLATGPSEAPQ